MDDYIIVKGAKVHNLKNINVKIPRNKFVVITGISGSGKSSLAFDTLYAEGQRRYVESLSAYARQFLGIMDKPDVEKIEGISPAISIEQRKIAKNPRSTVATVTEIYDYLRVLFARIGKPYCYNCGRKITSQTLDQIVDNILLKFRDKKIMILAPLVKGKKGEHKNIFGDIQRRGFIRVRVDGTVKEIEDIVPLDKNKKHNIEVVVDRLIIKEKIRHRLSDSVETALKEGDGIISVMDASGQEEMFSEKLACLHCGISYPDITPRLFSFNSPYGACKLCGGLGVKMEIDPDLIVINPHLSVMEGALAPIGEPRGKLYGEFLYLARRYKFDLNAPYYGLKNKIKNIIMYGDEEYRGLVNYLMDRYLHTESDWLRYEIEKYMSIQPCPECNGARLRKESLSIKIQGKNIHNIVKMDVKSARKFFNEELKLDERDAVIADELIKEIVKRLNFLDEVGVGYLTLDRPSETLSGGESERVHLATQIGSQLVGIMYILDEPSIGLHEHDIQRLIKTLKNLRDMGNTVIVVEHDRETMESADWIIDMGPGAGNMGGEIVAEGTIGEIKTNPKSITGAYLSERKTVPMQKIRKKPNGRYLEVIDASANNLKHLNIKIPIGLFVCVTGVSGSGKSTLVIDILYRALMRKLHYSRIIPGAHKEIKGVGYIDKVINIDQNPIGRTPRSNPATYTGAFTPIREFFTNLPDARMRGYKPGRFSFNVKGGRCESCRGDGVKKIEMHFLPDVYITCEVCGGKRFNKETLEVKYKGKNIADVLDMSVMEALNFFANIPSIERKLRLLSEVGLGYIKLGQTAPTLSGGEAQRIKLARELSKIATGNTLYILDEPTTGLHFEDIKMLLKILKRFTERGNTVLIIEHNPDIIKCADWIIDLGPEGGDGGGYIVAEGPPEKIAKSPASYTGKFLKKILKK